MGNIHSRHLNLRHLLLWATHRVYHWPRNITCKNWYIFVDKILLTLGICFGHQCKICVQGPLRSYLDLHRRRWTPSPGAGFFCWSCPSDDRGSLEGGARDRAWPSSLTVPWWQWICTQSAEQRIGINTIKTISSCFHSKYNWLLQFEETNRHRGTGTLCQTLKSRQHRCLRSITMGTLLKNSPEFFNQTFIWQTCWNVVTIRWFGEVVNKRIRSEWNKSVFQTKLLWTQIFFSLFITHA